jgi:potassium-dependent mechanosensitive channel
VEVASVIAILAVVLALATSPPNEAPTPIPVAQLVRAAESAYAELQRIADLAGPGGVLDRVASQLAGMEREIDQLRSAATVEGQTDYVGLEIRRRQSLVRRWDDELSTRVQQLDAAAGSLRRLVETWKLTVASLGTEIPPALVARATDVRDRASAMEGVVQERLALQLELQDRVATLKLALTGQLASLAAAEAARRQELFETESKPLWRPVVWTRSPGFPGPLRVFLTQVRAAASYTASEPLRSGMHLALAAALIAIGLAVTRRIRSGSAAPGRRPVPLEVVARYPIDSAVLLALLATPLLHPAGPPALTLLLNVAAVVPIMRVAGFLAPEWRRPVRWCAALYVAERLAAFTPQAGISARVALLAVTLAVSIACAAGFRNRGWLRELDAGRWKIPIAAAAGVAATLLAVSAVANLVGNASLAEVLTGATLKSAFAAAASVAVVVIASGTVGALLQLPYSSRFRIVRNHQELLVRRVGSLLRAAATAVWVLFTLHAFHATRQVREAAGAALAWRLKVGGLDLALGDVVAFAITLWIAIWLSRAIKFLLDEAALPSFGVTRGTATAISTTATYAVVGIGFGAAVLAAGVEMTRFAVLAGTLGVGIGFGLQNVVNNFVSGLILLYEQPVQVGDVIDLGQLSGTVRRIGVRSSTVRTFQGADVIVPNSNFISAEVVNWTGTDRARRVDIGLSVAYGTEPGRVVELLLASAKGCAGVAPLPEPAALFTGFGESALQFELRFWSTVDDWVTTASALRSSIYDALARAGIVLAFPQLDLWVRSVPPGTGRSQVLPGVAHLPSSAAREVEVPPRR